MTISVSAHSSDDNYLATKVDTERKIKEFASSYNMTVTTYYGYDSGEEIKSEGFQADIKLASIEEFLGKAKTQFPPQVILTGTSLVDCQVVLDKIGYKLAFPFRNTLTSEQFKKNIWVSETILQDSSNLSGKTLRIYNTSSTGTTQFKDVSPKHGMFVSNSGNSIINPYSRAELTTDLEFNKVYPEIDINSATIFGRTKNLSIPVGSFIVFGLPLEPYSTTAELYVYIGSAVHILEKENVEMKLRLGIFMKIDWLTYETNKILSQPLV